jgi:hypothetical protein
VSFALVFHGAVVLLLGQAAGYAFFRALKRAEDGAAAARWRMSHSACSVAALVLLALGPVVPQLGLDPVALQALTWTLIGSTWALCLGTVVAAASGQRGIERRGPVWNRVVWVLYVVGAAGSTVGGVALVIGVAYAWRRS